jgi:hypothetical protein
VVGCHAPATTVSNTAQVGLALSIYGTRTLVDDRRWLDVAGPVVTLEAVDASAELDSLVVEPTGELRVGTCSRDALPTEPARFVPVVRCRITGAPGRYLVRVAYFTTGFRFEPEHDVTITAAGRAVLSSRYTLATPPWHERADVRIFDGAPGSTPRELAHGIVVLDGSIAVLAAPQREIAAELRRIAVAAHDAPDDPSDHRPVDAAVWTKLALPDTTLAPGTMFVRVALPGEPAREATLRTAGGELALWPEPSLRALRQHELDYVAGSTLAERFTFSIANTGDAPREVSIEQPVRRDRHARLVRAIGKPALAGHVVRARVVVAPDALAHVAFTVAYQE